MNYQSQNLVTGPLLRVFPGELLSILHELILVLGVLLGYVCPEWVLWFWIVHKRHQGLDHLVGLGGGFPVFCTDDGETYLGCRERLLLVNQTGMHLQ